MRSAWFFFCTNCWFSIVICILFYYIRMHLARYLYVINQIQPCANALIFESCIILLFLDRSQSHVTSYNIVATPMSISWNGPKSKLYTRRARACMRTAYLHFEWNQVFFVVDWPIKQMGKTTEIRNVTVLKASFSMHACSWGSSIQLCYRPTQLSWYYCKLVIIKANQIGGFCSIFL